MNNSIKIYVVCHKKSEFPQLNDYCPIQVGAFDKEKIYNTTDNTGDNISNKNEHFCELTALYWIWKNSKEDIVGLAHYRRFFYRKSIIFDKKNILDSNSIKKILKRNDIILPQKAYLRQTLDEAYRGFHIGSDLDMCREVIKNSSPDYLTAFDTVMKGKSYHACNMIITRKEIFDQYCTWLFQILFELEKEINVEGRDKCNTRVFGFLSERLLNVWIYKNNNFKVIEKPVYNIENNMFIQIFRSLVKKIYGRVCK